MRRVVQAGLLFFLVQFAAAQGNLNSSGFWSISLVARTFLVLDLHDGADHKPAGRVFCPSTFEMSDGASFSNISNTVRVEPIVLATRRNDGWKLVVSDPAKAGDSDTLIFTQIDKTHVTLSFDGFPQTAMPLVKTTVLPVVRTDWDAATSYAIDSDEPSSAAMKRIFEEDQAPRQPGAVFGGKQIYLDDKRRREETATLMREGSLHTGEDFWRAAFLFQHGDVPEDYLLAHTLAMISVRKGNKSGLWIASAALDRYLQSIGKSQIYGTQYHTPAGKPVTQEPYDRDLISDALRKQLDVPSIAAQQVQKQQYENSQPKSK